MGLRIRTHWGKLLAIVTVAGVLYGVAHADGDKDNTKTTATGLPEGPTPERFDSILKRMAAARPDTMHRQEDLLKERYDLEDRPLKGVTMSRGKPVQEGVRAKLPKGFASWEQLAETSPDEIRDKGLFPAGFYPLPHPNQPEGGMVFPKSHIDEIKKQTARDLTRFDLDFDLPEHFLAESPAAIYLTTRPDLGDVSKGKLVTIENVYDLFDGILNPKQLEGLRLLLTPFPQQQYNATEDRRSVRASLGVTCFDCHANGHTNGATHLVGDIRPQQYRHRIDTPSLRGVNVQRMFGSQRALRTVDDFTEFEQRAAYFDGDTAAAVRKGVNILERGSQVHAMAEFQEILDFPPAPKLNVYGKLDPKKAADSEKRGQELFFGKAQCSVCHPPPYYTDGLSHNLQVERFYKEKMINGLEASADGPIKTFPLRGIKDSAPYYHDGRLLTLEDTVEFFNLVLELKLTSAEKKDLLAFLLTL
jgi:cytochrome c peroxidase